MNITKRPITKWIKDIIVLTIGILLIVAGATSSGDAADAISIVIGVALIVVGALSLCLALYVTFALKEGFVVLGGPGIVMISLGVCFLVTKHAMNMIKIVLETIPYLLIAVGVIFLCDAIFAMIKAKKIDSRAILYLIPEFVVSIAAIVLGILCLPINNGSAIITEGVQLIVLGIIVIIYSIYAFLLTVVKNKSLANLMTGR